MRLAALARLAVAIAALAGGTLVAAPAAQAMPAPAPPWGPGALLSIAQIKKVTGLAPKLAATSDEEFSLEVRLKGKTVTAPAAGLTAADPSTSTAMYPFGIQISKWPTTASAQRYYELAFEPPEEGRAERTIWRGGPQSSSGILLYKGREYMPSWAEAYAISGTMLANGACTLANSSLGADNKPKAPLSKRQRTALLTCAEDLTKALLAHATTGKLK